MQDWREIFSTAIQALHSSSFHFVDLAALGLTLVGILGYAPQAAGVAAFVWWCLRIYWGFRDRGRDDE